MGGIGPGRRGSAHQEWLRTGSITADPKWERHLTGRIPELAEIAAQATLEAGRDPATVDLDRVGEALAGALVSVMEPLFRRLELPWSDLLVVLERPDVSMGLLTDYLTTFGAKGVAAHDKVMELVTSTAVPALAGRIRAGECDAEDRQSGVPTGGSGPASAQASAGHLNLALRQGLLANAFEQTPVPGLYRATIDSPRCVGRRHNVFVAIADDSPTVLTPVGRVEEVTEAEVLRARERNDGCEVTIVASYRALARPLPLNRISPDLSAVLDAAFDLGAYGDLVATRLSGSDERRPLQ